MEDRITELEVKLAFAEDLLDTLNHTVFRQQEMIDRLVSEVRQIRQQVQAIPAGPAPSLRDELPPHY